MTLHLENQTLFYSRSMSPLKHYPKSLSGDSTDSGISSNVSSRKTSFQEEDSMHVARERLEKIPNRQKNLSNTSNPLLNKQIEIQINKDPQQISLESLYRMFIQQREEQNLENQQLKAENLRLRKKIKKKSEEWDLTLKELEEDAIAEIERLKQKLQQYES